MLEDDERQRAKTSRWSFSGPRHDQIETIEASCGSWMAALPDDLPLAFVSMPGTHNSASFAIARQWGLNATVVSASRCQACDFEAQLKLGIRFLDLRVRPDGQLCHGPVLCDFTLRDAFQVCSRFLSSHPGEVILTRVKDEWGGEKSACGVDALVHCLVDSAEFPVYLQMRLPTLREVRGRIVILRDWANGQLGVQWAGEAMRIQDQYWHRTGTKKWSVVKHHLGSAGFLHDCLQVNFTSATALPRKTPIQLARSVNPKLSDHIRSVPGRRFLGVVVMDFPSALLCDLIIRYNFRVLDPCRSPCTLVQCGPRCREWLDNLSCELMAAASRADALAMTKSDELKPGVQWLSRVFIKLLVERTCAETDEPAILENVVELACTNPVVTPAAVPLALPPGQQEMITTPDDLLQARSPKQGLLRRVGERFRRRRKRSSVMSVKSPIASPKRQTSERAAEHALIDTLECELEAAASRADAAAAAQPEELPERLQWLSRVCVRLVVSRVQAGRTSGETPCGDDHEIADDRETTDAETFQNSASSSDESVASARGEDLPCSSEPDDLPSRQSSVAHISTFIPDMDEVAVRSASPSPRAAPRSWSERAKLFTRCWAGSERRS